MKYWVCFIFLFTAGMWATADNPQVTLQISGGISGTIVLEIYADQAPVTAANFINYVQSGFYDGLIFHRVIADFMIQGGGFDPDLVKQATGPAIINESSNRLSNLRGTVAMARTSEADSATSEFFINVVDNTGDFGLDYGDYNYEYYYYFGKLSAQVGYCVFGEVVSGMDVVDSIAAVTTQTESGMQNVPVNDVIIQSATVTLEAPVCAVKPEGDANGDCRVDLGDLLAVARNWLTCDSVTPVCD